MPFDRRRFIRDTALAGLGAALVSRSEALAQNAGVRPAPMMPTPTFVDTNGISMAVYEKGSGPAVLFCHGFPELAFSWRRQVEAIAASGYHAIAPDQRGFGLTGGPEDPAQYDVQIFCDDLVGLMDAKGIDRAVFCGHDWGGFLVWVMARLHPERCLGVIGLCNGARRPNGMPAAKDARANDIVMTENYYINTFMEPGRAEAVLEADVQKTFDFLLSRGGIWDKDGFAQMPVDSDERQMNLLAMLQRDDPPGEPFLPEEEVRYFVETYEATGFTGGLNWYRSIPLIEEIMAKAVPRIEVPCLYIGAENDVILPPYFANGMEDFVPDLEKHTVMDSGHWVQQEKPEEVNRLIIDWLNRRIA